MVLANISLNMWYLSLIVIDLAIITFGISFIISLISSYIQNHKRNKFFEKELKKDCDRLMEEIKNQELDNKDKED